jgi:hypothetical protein
VIGKNAVCCCETMEKREDYAQTMCNIDVDDVVSSAISSISQKSPNAHSPGFNTGKIIV